MSLIRWQPHAGFDFLSMRMVRLVNSGIRLPLGPPRCASISPPGPCSSNLFFQPYNVCLETPTSGAKSPAGRPLRCQVSRISSRCSAVMDGCGESSGFTSRRPLALPVPTNRGFRNGSSNGSSGKGPSSKGVIRQLRRFHLLQRGRRGRFGT